ncbi:MAG: chromosomal replication initiator protein DnaA [Clostridia bacterium]|nr:chromosomal replication initiator protein DnaA [Clostridia bacterium]
MDFYSEAELSGIWQATVDVMRQNYEGSHQSFALWFGLVRLTALDANSAEIACENKMKQTVLTERYLPFIRNSLEEVIGYPPDLTVKVDPTLAPPLAAAEKEPPIRTMLVDADDPAYADDDELTRPPLIVKRPRPAGADPSRENDASRPSPVPEKPEKVTATNPADEEETAAPQNPGDVRLTLNDDYTFENFIVGRSNHFAHAAAVQVADNVGMKINPLFIWGPSGLGKTHLMYAIANRAMTRDPRLKVVYVKAEEFMNQMIKAIQTGKNHEFRQKYRTADMLLIDDIQFIAGKDSTQTEFFHTFDALYEDKKQIILTSDRPPKELTSLEERIRSRFEAGLLVDIQPPDYELRMAILRDKISQSDMEVPLEVIDFLAQNLQENIRQLEGVVKKLAMKHLLSGDPINMEMVLRTVPEYLHSTEPVTETVNRIIADVASHYGVKPDDILGKDRKKNIQTARNVSMYLVRTMTSASLPQIGMYFNRDHSTVHSNIGKVEGELASDAVFEATVGEIMKEIKRGG